jgi:hypothetical protein
LKTIGIQTQKLLSVPSHLCFHYEVDSLPPAKWMWSDLDCHCSSLVIREGENILWHTYPVRDLKRNALLAIFRAVSFLRLVSMDWAWRVLCGGQNSLEPHGYKLKVIIRGRGWGEKEGQEKQQPSSLPAAQFPPSVPSVCSQNCCPLRLHKALSPMPLTFVFLTCPCLPSLPV